MSSTELFKEQARGSLALLDATERTSGGVTPMQLAQMAGQIDTEKLLKLMEMQERLEANEARKSFLGAFSAFKAEAVRIIKGAAVNDGPLKGKKYADLFSIVDAVTPALSQHGLTLSWKLTKDEPQWMEVTCTLRHEQGHSESVSMGGAPDTGPGRNAIQARGSAKTYLERYTATAILGMAAADQDDDGRGASKPDPQGESMEESVAMDFVESIEGSGDVDELQRNYFAARDAAQKIGDKIALTAFAEAKNKHYMKLTRRAK